MPKAAEFERWSIDLLGRADELSALVGPLIRASSGVVVGGRFGVMVDVGLRAGLANAQSAASMVRAHADECVRRAGVCREYTTAMNVYEAECASFPSRQAAHVAASEESKGRWPVGPAPTYPVAPVRVAPWVERG